MLYLYHNNLKKREIKMLKMYFLNTGLCSYLCGWDLQTPYEQLDERKYVENICLC